MNELSELIQKLEGIATKNGDDFRYCIDVTIRHHQPHSYIFRSIETVDGHDFLTGEGFSIESAVAAASSDLESTCEEWGYDIP